MQVEAPQYSEGNMCCQNSHSLDKRNAGFSKQFVNIIDKSIANSNMIQVYFCSACDNNVITFASDEFYTCSELCDIFICKSCAECSNGHTLKFAKNNPGSNEIYCTRCNSLFMKQDVQNGYFRCSPCNQSYCNNCIKRPQRA